ncbi:MAG TPA: PEP-CTERM sorting domain-containing protein [Myxococcota bacterium]|nr:PEP-CTERM sorting domain-containing protein [Myxococcota bacterium]
MLRRVATLIAAALALSAPAHAQPRFEVVATGAPTAGFDVRISADGAVATIGSLDPVLGAAGAVRIELATGASTLLAFGIGASAFPSADGSVVMGTEYNASAVVYRWTAAGRTTVPTLTSIAALSADGSRYAGTDFNVSPPAYVATYAPGPPVLTALGDLPGGFTSTNAYGISGDGTIVVGTSSQTLGWEAFRWTQADGMVGLGDLPGGAFASSASDASQDGTTIVGSGTSASGLEAFVWRNGLMTGIGDLPGGSFESIAHGVSGDGAVVVGSGSKLDGSGPASIEAAFVHDAQGMHDLEALLVDGYGLDLEGAQLRVASDVSADGNVIVGYGVDGTQNIAWVAVIPEPGASSGLGAGVVALAGLSRRRATSGSRRG